MDERRQGVVKRSVSIAGHRTSVSLEGAFWDALGELARQDGSSVQALIETVDTERGRSNLSSAIRVHVLAAARAGRLASPDMSPCPVADLQPPG